MPLWIIIAGGAAVLVGGAIAMLVASSRKRGASETSSQTSLPGPTQGDSPSGKKGSGGPASSSAGEALSDSEAEIKFVVPEEVLVDKAEKLKNSVRELTAMAQNLIKETDAFTSRIGDHKINIAKMRTLTEIRELEKHFMSELTEIQETNKSVTGKLSSSAKKISEQEKLLDQLRVKSITDGLTTLYNRPAFDGKLREEIDRLRRYESPCTLIIADIDRFKQINDTYGHTTGDRVLQILGKIFKSNIRSIDFAARYGGEEFAVILPETNIDEGLAAAERIRMAVETTNFVRGEKRIKITISLGVATGQKTDTFQSWIERSDSALYRAKEGGRNQVQVGK